MSYYLAIGYAIGCWIYGLAYMWTHWEGLLGVGILAVYAFARALIWPLWVILYMVN
ncbi:MAG: hypothetical protein O7A64_03740 [Alphaproteobacteria bacterium]|nr:hypothetical protein [Alphaproteobacteria bacterium]